MKKNTIQPMFVTLKRPHDNYTAVVNVDDLKMVVFHKAGKQVVDVHTSNHELTLDASTGLITQLERELKSRYTLVTLNDGIGFQPQSKAYNAILVLDTPEQTRYIWPRGLSMIKVEDNRVAITMYGDEQDISHTLRTVPAAVTVADMFRYLHVV